MAVNMTKGTHFLELYATDHTDDAMEIPKLYSKIISEANLLSTVPWDYEIIGTSNILVEESFKPFPGL